MIIDAHVNITPDGRWFQTEHNASLERLLDEMARASVDRCLLVSMPGAATNRFIASVVERYPEKFRGVVFSGDLEKQVDEIQAMGLSGVKIHPRAQGINLCDERYDSLWRHFNDRRVTLLVDGYLQTAHPSVQVSHLLPLAYERHVKAHPDVTFILAHAGAHRVMDTFFFCRSCPNVYCDLSYSLSVFKDASFYRDFAYLARHADQKVLFGSDFPEISLMDAKNDFQQLVVNVEPDKTDRLWFQNALRLFWEKR